MKDQIFRKKSLERIETPEEIRDYLHISNPRLWMILSAILVILIGFVVFASVTTIENTISCKAHVVAVSVARNIERTKVLIYESE